MDYAFLNHEGGSDPVLVMEDSHSGYIFAWGVPRKGVDEWVVKAASKAIDFTGRKEYNLKCDGGKS